MKRTVFALALIAALSACGGGGSTTSTQIEQRPLAVNETCSAQLDSGKCPVDAILVGMIDPTKCKIPLYVGGFCPFDMVLDLGGAVDSLVSK